MPPGAALKLTVAVYLSYPDGRNINKKGITPDIVAPDRPKTKPDDALQARAAVHRRAREVAA